MSMRIVAIIALVATFALAVSFTSPKRITMAYEDALLTMLPSAERAYTYGIKYFDAIHPDKYDVARAEYLFHKTYEIDSAYPNVNHQLARISFLRGDFEPAIAYINAELEKNPSPTPSTYYIRGLIEGYMDDFESAEKDYETYLHSDPKNWAAINDYAWVLMKENRPLDALVALDWGLIYWPDNPWLLNSKATAHFELEQYELARDAAMRAGESVMKLTDVDWLKAYPGNDPLIAESGIRAFQLAVFANVHTIALAMQKAMDTMQ